MSRLDEVEQHCQEAAEAQALLYGKAAAFNTQTIPDLARDFRTVAEAYRKAITFLPRGASDELLDALAICDSWLGVSS